MSEPAQRNGGSAAAASGWVRPFHNPWLIAVAVSLAAFMEVLDTNIANVALPYIAGGLSSSVEESTWVLTSYLISNAIVLPITGWLSNLIGRKRFYMLCVGLFSLSSLLCGLAPTLSILIMLRVLQGAAGGGLQPVSQAILADTFPPERFGMAFAVYGMAVVLAPAIGPVLGGYITDAWNWRWIFFINIPVGILALMLAERLVDDPAYLKREMAKVRANLDIDYAGLILLAVGLGCLQIVFDKGQEDGWFASQFITALLVIAAVALCVFVVWELTYSHPVMDLKLMRNPNFAMASLMMFILGLVIYMVAVMVPQYLQNLMGYDAELAGMALAPGALVMIVCLPLVGRLVTMIDARYLIAFGFLITSAAMWHISGIDTQIDFKIALTYRAFQALGTSFLFVPINTEAYVGVPQEKGGEVAGTINLCRNVGGSVGISALETLLARRAQYHQSHLAWHTNPYQQTFRGAIDLLSNRLFHRGLAPSQAAAQSYARVYQGTILQATSKAYIDVAWLAAMVCVCMVPVVFLMRKGERGGFHPLPE